MKQRIHRSVSQDPHEFEAQLKHADELIGELVAERDALADFVAVLLEANARLLGQPRLFEAEFEIG